MSGGRIRSRLSAAVVRTVASLPVAAFRLPPSVIASIFDLRRRSAGLELRSCTVGRFTIPYLEHAHPNADPTAAPVLFVHGFSDTKDSFVEVARAVVGGHRVVLLDLPGFGDASAPTDFCYDLPSLAGLVAEFCDSVGLSGTHFVGSSLGGAVSVQVALERPDLVRSLTLIGAAGLTMPQASPLQLQLDAGHNPFVVETFEEYEAFMRFVLERQPPIPGPVRRALADAFIARASLNEKIMSDLLDGHVDLTGRLAEIEADALVVWGDKDRLIDISAGRVYRDGIRGSLMETRMVIFHGVGHCPQYEDPERTGRYVRRFLEEQAARALD